MMEFIIILIIKAFIKFQSVAFNFSDMDFYKIWVNFSKALQILNFFSL